MKFNDPKVQTDVLTALAKSYNRSIEVLDLAQSVGLDLIELQNVLTLLIEWDLAEAIDATASGSETLHDWIDPRITAKGLKHLGLDGGIGLAVSTVTIAFDADSLRALIAARVEGSSMPEAEKSKWRSWLSSAGEAGLKEATKHLVEAAIRHWPDALQAMQNMRG